MLVILTSHPIQYQAPLWRALATDGRVPFSVWFLTPHAVKPSMDQQFGQVFAWDEDLTDGYPHRFVPIAPNWQMNAFRGVKVTEPWTQQFREHGVTDLWVEGWRFAAYWSAIRAARKAGVRIWMRGENNDLTPCIGWRAWGKARVMRWLFRRVDHFLTIGSANRRYYLQHGIAPHQLHPAPYAVDNATWRERCTTQRKRCNELRERWQIPTDRKCVLFCGKLIDKKRPLDVVRAAHALQLKGTPLHLLFAGDGPLHEVLATALQQPGAPSGTITGFLNLSEIAGAFAVADCLVLPSNSGETWGLVVNEAMACGLPVVVSNQCGSAEDLALPLGANFVFPGGNTEALANSLHAVLAAPPTAEQIRAVIDRHDFRVTVETAVRLSLHSSPH